MKIINNFFALGLTIIAAFSSCGSDDDPTPIVKSGEYTYTYEIPIEGIANSQQKPEAAILKLESLMGENAATFISGDFQRGKCSIQISGLNTVDETALLKDFTITVGNRNSINLGNCSPLATGSNDFLSDYEHNSDNYTDIVKYIFEDLVSKQKQSIVSLSYTPSVKIDADKNKVFLKITVTGLMKYNVYSE